MNTLKRWLANPTVRLAVRALLAGVGVFVSTMMASPSWDRSVLMAALTAAGMAALEAFTPLNQLVGWLKGQPVELPPLDGEPDRPLTRAPGVPLDEYEAAKEGHSVVVRPDEDTEDTGAA